MPKNRKIFQIGSVTFSEEESKTGVFNGILVNMENNHEPAKGYYVFNKGSMEGNNNKKLFMLYNHNGDMIPIGTMTGIEAEKGFEIEGKFDLNKLENGNYINEEAAKIYSLLKNEKAPFELSVGGNIVEYKERAENGKYIIDILKFDAYEGSITPKGAVKGSKITTVFNKNNNDNLGGTLTMNEEMKQFLEELFTKFRADIYNAKDAEEVMALPKKFKALEENFSQVKDSLSAELTETYNKKFEELNEIIKGLKTSYIPTATEYSEAVQFAAMLDEVEKLGLGRTKEYSRKDIINFADPATTTGDQKAGVRPEYATKILERIQENNPILSDISFIPTTENSYILPVEMLGLPETGWVGETATRAETVVTKLKQVIVTLNQLYAMPVVSNKLMGVNFVGYVNFLLKRVEQAMSLTIANSIFNGTGTNSPLGLLKDTNVTQTETIDDTDDTTFIDSLIDIFYSVKSDISANAKWYMTRNLWAKIAKLKNASKDFYITDLNTGNTRTLMTRPVVIIESAGAGLKEFDSATAGTDYVGVFADLNMGILAIQNPNLTVSMRDQVTSKGLTKFYTEKGLGAGVQLPEYITKITKA